MLGNNADAFFMTPMRTSVVNGGNVRNQTPMPSPRGAGEGATVTRRSWLPGFGEEAAEDMAPAPTQPVAAAPAGHKLALTIAVIGGLFVFFAGRK